MGWRWSSIVRWTRGGRKRATVLPATKEITEARPVSEAIPRSRVRLPCRAFLPREQIPPRGGKGSRTGPPSIPPSVSPEASSSIVPLEVREPTRSQEGSCPPNREPAVHEVVEAFSSSPGPDGQAATAGCRDRNCNTGRGKSRTSYRGKYRPRPATVSESCPPGRAS
jgi:hypothetical protein